MKTSLVLGSRGSQLALRQAEWVRARFALLYPTVRVDVVIIKTSGDIKTEPLSVIGGKGVFTKELEDALIDRRIDIAVHSLKDLPTILSEPLMICAICEREDPRDALVIRPGIEAGVLSISGLPKHAVIGTSSQRRLAQLKHLRDDFAIRDLRGNVDTRLRKLDEAQYDALVLASAGLRRLGLEHRISLALPTEQMLPAVGQGAIALESRADDNPTSELAKKLNHEPTMLACLAERALLRALGGGCQLPIAGHAILLGQQLRLEGLVADKYGRQIIRDHVQGTGTDAEQLGIQLGQRLLEQGAKALIAADK